MRSQSWNPASRRPEDVANLRVSQALLWLCRSGQVDIDASSDMARVLWPLLRRHPRLMREALAAMQDTPEDWGARHADIDFTGWFAASSRSVGSLPESVPAEVLEALGVSMIKGRSRIQRVLDAAEADLERLITTRTLSSDTNVKILSELLQLSEIEHRFLRLATAVETSGIGSRPFTSVNGVKAGVRGLQVALGGVSDQAVRSMLRRSSPLIRSGLVDGKQFLHGHDLEDVLRLSRAGMRLLTSRTRSLDGMAGLVLQRLREGTGDDLSWPHLEDRARMLRQLLRRALDNRETGINILLHGDPGTGKTQFAARMIAAIRAHGFSVRDTDEDGDPASREQRLSSLMLSQFFAPAGGSVLVLDEAEDIFQSEYNNPFGRIFAQKEQSKSWLNNLLENNPQPVIWISNRVDHLDPAYVRRFTYCLEFPPTPRRVREQIVRAHLEPVGCSSATVHAIAADAKVSPALAASAARFTALAALQGEEVDEGVRLMLTDTLKAMGTRITTSVPERSTRFDLQYLNTRGVVTSAAVLGGLERTGRGRVLLSGPPGTGKTQLAAEVAQRLGRELVYRTASDINSKWFGESERNVARLFEDCDIEGEVLFLDEADALLGGREGTQRAEVAVTSEFLRQVEAFRGVFMCATNFRDKLDMALLRRFEYRLELLPLTVPQRRALLCECAIGWVPGAGTPLPALPLSVSARLDRLDQLTPGDFANVVRRLRSLQLSPDLAGWIEELEAEHATKPGARRGAMGFV